MEQKWNMKWQLGFFRGAMRIMLWSAQAGVLRNARAVKNNYSSKLKVQIYSSNARGPCTPQSVHENAERFYLNPIIL